MSFVTVCTLFICVFMLNRIFQLDNKGVCSGKID